MEKWYCENIDSEWMNLRNRIMALLQDEAELDEIVKLVGMDALNAHDRLKLEAARSIREDYLHQDAFHEVDTYASLKKQCEMMKLVLYYFDTSTEAADRGANINKLIDVPVRERIGRIKYVPEDKVPEEARQIKDELDKETEEVLKAVED